MLATPFDTLRAAGLSGNKATFANRPRQRALGDGRINTRKIPSMSDDEIVEHLCSVRGIGRWTAEMFLMFHLGRLDVWPTGDLGVRNGYGKAWGLPATPTAKELDAAGRPRSVRIARSSRGTAGPPSKSPHPQGW